MDDVFERYDRGRAGDHPFQDGGALPLLWFNEIDASLDVRDFVQGLLAEESAIVVYGESNAGKTFWVTDLALHVAAGLPWNGRRIEQSGVVYAVLEGGNGFRNRIAAWRDANDLSGVDIPFAAIPASLNLLNPDADTPRLIAAMGVAAARMQMPVRLVVIDTLSRALAGGSENDSEDMGALVANMDSIRQATGAAVLFIHHSGKDTTKGARGHSLLRAAVDTEIEVVADGDTKTATVVKQREMGKGDAFPFSLRVVELGHNRHGEPITTCVVEAGEAGTGRGTAAHRRLTGHNRRAHDVLTDLVAVSGQDGHHGVPPGFLSVPEKWWRDRFDEQAMPGAEEDAKRKAFRRAADKLVELQIVGVGAKRVWLVSFETRTTP